MKADRFVECVNQQHNAKKKRLSMQPWMKVLSKGSRGITSSDSAVDGWSHSGSGDNNRVVVDDEDEDDDDESEIDGFVDQLLHENRSRSNSNHNLSDNDTQSEPQSDSKDRSNRSVEEDSTCELILDDIRVKWGVLMKCYVMSPTDSIHSHIHACIVKLCSVEVDDGLSVMSMFSVLPLVTGSLRIMSSTHKTLSMNQICMKMVSNLSFVVPLCLEVSRIQSTIEFLQICLSSNELLNLSLVSSILHIVDQLCSVLCDFKPTESKVVDGLVADIGGIVFVLCTQVPTYVSSCLDRIDSTRSDNIRFCVQKYLLIRSESERGEGRQRRRINVK